MGLKIPQVGKGAGLLQEMVNPGQGSRPLSEMNIGNHGIPERHMQMRTVRIIAKI
jgi:hypothetical protein